MPYASVVEFKCTEIEDNNGRDGLIKSGHSEWNMSPLYLKFGVLMACYHERCRVHNRSPVLTWLTSSMQMRGPGFGGFRSASVTHIARYN